MSVQEAVQNCPLAIRPFLGGIRSASGRDIARAVSSARRADGRADLDGKNLTIMANTLLMTFRNRKLTMYRDEADVIRDLGRLMIVEKPYGYSSKHSR